MLTRQNLENKFSSLAPRNRFGADDAADRPVKVRMADGSLAPVRDVLLTPDPKTGEPTFVLDLRDLA